MHKDFQPTSVGHGVVPGPQAPTGLQRLLQSLGLGAGPACGHPAALYSQQGLLALSDRLVAGWGGTAALAMFDFHDLLEARDIYGSSTSQAAQRALVDCLLRLAGRHGIAARTGPAQFAVLLPGTSRDDAVAATLRVFGSPCRLEVDLPGDELVLVPEVAVDTCNPEPGAVRQLFEALCTRLAHNRELQEKRCAHLRRSRERHSRPAPLEQLGHPELRGLALS